MTIWLIVAGLVVFIAICEVLREPVCLRSARLYDDPADNEEE